MKVKLHLPKSSQCQKDVEDNPGEELISTLAEAGLSVLSGTGIPSKIWADLSSAMNIPRSSGKKSFGAVSSLPPTLAYSKV